MAQRQKKVTRNLHQPINFEETLHSAVLVLWEINYTSHLRLCFIMKNGPHSLSIKLLVHPSIMDLNNISLNNCKSLLVLFTQKKNEKETMQYIGLGIKLIKIVNVNNNI